MTRASSLVQESNPAFGATKMVVLWYHAVISMQIPFNFQNGGLETKNFSFIIPTYN